MQNFLSNFFKVRKLSDVQVSDGTSNHLPLCAQEALCLINNFDSKEADGEEMSNSHFFCIQFIFHFSKTRKWYFHEVNCMG